MNHGTDRNELTFEEFLAARLRDKGISLKRLSEITGIAPIHIENLFHGNFEHMPSRPYFRGYLIRLGKVLDFDGEEWWERIQKDDFVKDSGPADALPHNRFIKRALPKSAWIIGIVALIVVIYLLVSLPHILGKPALTFTFPPANPYTTTSTTLVFRGMAQNADALYLSNGNASSGEEVPVATDGSWQKTVLLSESGLNTFAFTAKKFLGGETTFTEQVIYEAASSSAAATSSQL